MREIKFRAWDPINKIMYFSDESHKEYLSFSAAGGKTYWQFDFDSSRRNILLDSNTGILMQYTGLKDRNGVEIYDGDIVNYQQNKDELRLAFIEWSDLHARYYIKSPLSIIKKYNIKVPIEDLNSLNIKNIECIGNIYEKPELFEVNHGKS